MSFDHQFRPVRSADRTLDLLELLAGHHEGLSFKEIAARLQLPKSSLSGLLRTLVARGYAVRTADGRRYRLGAKVVELSAAYSPDQATLLAAEAALAPLAEQVGAQTLMAVLDGDEVLYLATSLTGSTTEPLPLRERFPAHATAAGKCLLAQIALAALDQRLGSQFSQVKPATVMSVASLKRELAQVRRLGYAYDIDERAAGQHAIAAPVYDAQGHPIAAIEIALPRDQLHTFDLSSLPRLLLTATAALTGGERSLIEGWRPGCVKIAWSMGTLRNQAYQTVYRTVENLAESLDSDVIWTDARDDPAKQVVDVSGLLALGPDVLVIHPAHAVRADELFALAAQAGVTAINFQRPVRSNQVEFFVGGDTFEQGRMTAAFVATLLGRRGNVAIIEGDHSNDNARNQAQGIRTELRRHPQIHILSTASSPTWSRERARSLADSILETHGDAVHAFLVANDDMAGGVAEALDARRRAGKVILVGGDGDLDALERIRSGVQHGTGFQNWVELGRETLHFAIHAARGDLACDQLQRRAILYDPPGPPVYVKDLPYVFIERTNLPILERFWTEAIGMALPEMLPLVAPAFRAMDEGR